MSISSTSPVKTANGNGSKTSFSFGFQVDSDSHLDVYIDDVEQGSGFTINRNANQESSPGGTVDFDTAPSSGEIVAIVRKRPYSRASDFEELESGNLRSSALNDEFDAIWQAIQEIDAKLGRSVLRKYGTADEGKLFPEMTASDDGKALTVDSSGEMTLETS